MKLFNNIFKLMIKVFDIPIQLLQSPISCNVNDHLKSILNANWRISDLLRNHCI